MKYFQEARRWIIATVVLIFVLFVFFNTLGVNGPTEVSIITTLGRVSSVEGSGVYYKLPFVARSTVYDTSIQSIECQDNAGKSSCRTLDGSTKDLQAVKVAVQVSYRIDSDKPEELFRLVQDQQTFSNIIVPSTVEEALKVTTARYSAEELVIKREEVKTALEEELQNRLDQFFLTVVSVNIVNFQFSESFQNEIDLKVATQQQILQKEAELKRTETEAKIKVTQAQGEADAIRVQGDALRQNPEALELQKIQKWDGKLPLVEGSGISPVISLPQLDQKTNP